MRWHFEGGNQGYTLARRVLDRMLLEVTDNSYTYTMGEAWAEGGCFGKEAA